jgi:hypothetical protein
MRGVALGADQWELDTEEMGELLAPIIAFQGEHVLQTHDLYNDEEVHVFQDAVPVSVRRLHSYWLSKRTPSRERSDLLPQGRSWARPRWAATTHVRAGAARSTRSAAFNDPKWWGLLVIAHSYYSLHVVHKADEVIAQRLQTRPSQRRNAVSTPQVVATRPEQPFSLDNVAVCCSAGAAVRHPTRLRPQWDAHRP